MRAVIEAELKIALDPAGMARLLRHPALPGLRLAPRQTRQLISVYYDTEAHALAAAGIALRLRRSGRRWVQTVKRRSGAAAGMEAGVHQGWVRLVGQDGLPLDDIRFFAFEVQPAWPVLIAAPADVSTTYLELVLAPPTFRETRRAQFHSETIDQSRLATQELAGYRAIALVDPEPLTPEVWTKLADFCERGGGLAYGTLAAGAPVARLLERAWTEASA